MQEGSRSISEYEMARGQLRHAHEQLIKSCAPELLKALKKSTEGWDNALRMGLIAEEHRTSASLIRDQGYAAIAKAEGRA